MEPINHPIPIPGTLTAVGQIQLFHHSKSLVDRKVWTRVRVTELFLRVLVESVKEALYVVLVLPTAAKFVLDRAHLGHLLSWSVSFGTIADHLKRSSQCATALALDFPVIFFDPSTAQARLVNRKLLAAETQPEPITFKSLLTYVWTPKAITVVGVVITAVALYRLIRFTSGNTPDIIPPITPFIPHINWTIPLTLTAFASSLLGCGGYQYRRFLLNLQKIEQNQIQSNGPPIQYKFLTKKERGIAIRNLKRVFSTHKEREKLDKLNGNKHGKDKLDLRINYLLKQETLTDSELNQANEKELRQILSKIHVNKRGSCSFSTKRPDKNFIRVIIRKIKSRINLI